jgi:hypothetical protein
MKLLTLVLVLMVFCCAPCAAQLPVALPQPEPALEEKISALLADALHYGKGTKIFVADYTHIQTITRRRADKKGHVTEESDAWEAYLPSQQNRKKPTRWVRIRIMENGVALPADKIEKERLRASEKLMEAEEESQKLTSRASAGKADQDSVTDARGAYFNLTVKRGLRGSIEFDVRTILQQSSFDAPRRELLNGRETLVLDFRPKPAMQLPEAESFITEMSGTVWFDAADRVLIKAEGWPMSMPLRRGKPAVFYQAVYVPGNKWLPHRISINGLSYKTFFGGFEQEVEAVLSEYKLFGSEIKDEKINKMISENLSGQAAMTGGQE